MSLFHLFRPVLNGLNDMGITRAAAEIAFQTMNDLFASGIRICLQELDTGHDHSRRAEAALQRVALPKTCLNRMQFPVAAQAFDGRDVRAIRLNREHGAGFHRFSIQQDGARAAQARFASDVRPRQPAAVPKEMNQKQAGIDFMLVGRTIDADGYGRFHRRRLPQLRFAGLPWAEL